MAAEIERRYVVSSIDPEIRRFPAKRILQGYFETTPLLSLRVRIVDESKAFLTKKSGSGLSRYEDERPIELDMAHFLLAACPYVLTKTRYLRDGWEVDFFEGPLTGLVVVEFEMRSETEQVTLPSWIKDGREVTDSLTNLHLARLAHDLTAGGSDSIRAMLPQPIHKVVLTGGPCTGKSKIMEALRKDAALSDQIHFVPEVATIVISQVGAKPSKDNPVAQRAFQRAIYQTQTTFEQVSQLQAVRDGKSMMLMDRGRAEISAFLRGGVSEMAEAFHTTVDHEHAQYNRVIYLGLPTRDIYEGNKANNEARTETYQEAETISDRILEAWQNHPGLTRIAASESFESKFLSARSELLAILSALKSA